MVQREIVKNKTESDKCYSFIQIKNVDNRK